MAKAMVLIIGLVLAVLLMIPLAFLNAWSIEVCWNLLAAPLGWTLPFTIKEIVVILFIKGMIFQNFKYKEDASNAPTPEIIGKFLTPFLVPLMFIGLAWILSHFIH